MDAEVAGLRATLVVIVIVIGITSWASTARVIRSQTLSVKERMFVDRARVIGSGSGHIMRKHVLPNVMNLIVANTVLVFAGAVFTETTLSFIGLGDPFLPSWGQMLNSAEAAGAPGLGAWWYIAPPATCVVLVILGVHARRQRPRRHPQSEVGGPSMSGPTFSAPMHPEDAAADLESEGTLVGDESIRDEAGTEDAAAISRAALEAEVAAGATLGRRRWPLPKQADPNAPLLVVENLRTYFTLESGTVKAVDGVSFTLEPRRGARDRR